MNKINSAHRTVKDEIDRANRFIKLAGSSLPKEHDKKVAELGLRLGALMASEVVLKNVSKLLDPQKKEFAIMNDVSQKLMEIGNVIDALRAQGKLEHIEFDASWPPVRKGESE